MVCGIRRLETCGRENGFPLGMDIWEVETQHFPTKHYAHDYYKAMVPGGTSNEVTQLNIESLWSGGPFADKVRISILLTLAYLTPF